ncbi:MAG: TRAP transporter substrate-binding protein [Pseudomonadota bacterium]
MPRLWSFLLAAAVPALAFAPPAAAQKWLMASGYGDTFYHTGNLAEFVDDVKKSSGGKLEVELHKNQTLIKLPEIKRAVQTEQVQLGEILLSQYGNEDALFEINDIPFLAEDFDRAEKLWSIAKGPIAKRIADKGMRVLYEGPWPTSGFYYRAPVTSLEEIKGVKLRVYSAMTRRMGELMGTIPTIVPFAEVPQAFATKVVDAMFTAPQLGLSLQAWDFIKAYTDVGSHVPMNLVIVNEVAFKRLLPDAQNALLAAAGRAQVRAWQLARASTNTQKQTLAGKGMTVTRADAKLMAQLEPIGRTLLAEWLQKAGPDGEAIIKSYRQ